MLNISKDFYKTLKQDILDSFKDESLKKLNNLYSNCLNSDKENSTVLDDLRLYKRAESIAKNVISEVIRIRET